MATLASHLGQELAESSERVHVKTRFGAAVGGRAKNGAAVFLGERAILLLPWAVHSENDMSRGSICNARETI